VNPRAAQYRVSSKLLQLRVARQLGFAIPRTIVTNDRERIAEFMRSAPAGVIHKTFNAMGVRSEKGVTVFETATFTEADLPSEAVQSLTIGIVQERVAKAYEVRVVVFGHAFYALRIDSQSRGDSAVDYRHHLMADLPTSASDVPEAVRERCLRFMREFGILFGAFDFIVTEAGDWVFLEVNEAGQFLFMEEAVPEMRILAGFCEFLMRPAPDFLPSASLKAPALVEVYASEAFRSALEEDRATHVPPIR
jgi:glutathione synthase/RimK-type ligase-like ATP-grasp enzyme